MYGWRLVLKAKRGAGGSHCYCLIFGLIGTKIRLIHAIILTGSTKVSSFDAYSTKFGGVAREPERHNCSAAGSGDVDDLAVEVLATLPEMFLPVGHSFGDYVSLAILEREPARIEGLMLVGTLDNADTETGAENRRQKAREAADGGYSEIAEAASARACHPRDATRVDLLESRSQAIAEYGPDLLVAHQMAAARRHHRSAVLSNAKLPRPVASGDADVVIPTAKQHAMAQRTGADFRIVPRPGHMLPAERPRALAGVISQWLTDRHLDAGSTNNESRQLMTQLPEYKVIGNGGTTVFLLHGAYGDGSYFENTAKVLAGDGYRVVVWNCPGYGNSPAPVDASIEAFAAAASTLVKAEATTINVVLGHSMGGLIGPRLANIEPLVDGLVLSAASAGFASRTPEDQKRYLAERLQPIEEGQSVAEYVRPLLKSMMGPGAQGQLVDHVFEVILAMKTETFANSIRAISAYDGRQALKDVAVPTLLLSGTADTACPVGGMRKMAEVIDDSRIYEMEGVGHYGFAERPDEYHAELLKFLQQRFPARPGQVRETQHA